MKSNIDVSKSRLNIAANLSAALAHVYVYPAPTQVCFTLHVTTAAATWLTKRDLMSGTFLNKLVKNRSDAIFATLFCLTKANPLKQCGTI